MKSIALALALLPTIAFAQNAPQVMTPDQRLAMQNATLNLQLARMATDLDTAKAMIADLQKQIDAAKKTSTPVPDEQK